MALHVPKAPGFAQMLKEGAKHFSGLEEAVYRNISACKEFAETVRSAYGPNGLNKIVINHIDKLFVTNDAATIIRELEVEHPAAKMMVYASQIQEEEVGDGTNFVIIFCGALLEQAENLLRMGLTPVEIGLGYERALKKALEILPNLSCHNVTDLRSLEAVTPVIKSAVMSKQYGQEEFLASVIAKACVSVLPETTAFNVDNIRVCKILGMGLNNSEVVQGMVFKKNVEGDIVKKSNAKIVIYTCPVDISTTETKGTVLIKTAEELMGFSEGEESLLEKQVKALKDAGAEVVVSGGKVGDMALHFINKLGLMAVRLNSKFDIRRLCKTVSATPLPNFTTPLKEELGFADLVYTDEIGDTPVVVFRLEGKESKVVTCVLRGATDNSLDDIERSVDDGVNTFKTLTKDGRLLPGAGAAEVEIAKEVRAYADSLPGMQQYAVLRFADALETLPKALAENSGLNGTNAVCALRSAHEAGDKNAGLNIEGTSDNLILDANASQLYDTYLNKMWSLKYATETASMILRVDQIIMAKKAGGPAAKAPKPTDDDD